MIADLFSEARRRDRLELQEFLEWAKSKGVFKMTVGDLHVEFFHKMLRDIPFPPVSGVPGEQGEGEPEEIPEEEVFHSAPE